MSEPITTFFGTYRWLSNFYACSIRYDGMTYPSVEHAYQASKTLHIPQRRMIRALTSPGQAKRAGRRVTVRPDWDQVRVGVMRGLLRQKFALPYFAQKLLATGDALIKESNTWGDTFWGVDSRTGEGQNMLGKLLMEIREELHAKE